LFRKNEIESIVKELGFNFVYLEDLLLTQQIDLCSKASIIAGFHGAGLSNIVWANSGAKVVEITGTRVTSHFEHLSKICGHDFHRFNIESDLLDLQRLLF
jgi:capsular polysaccharide biosynthesis protein